MFAERRRRGRRREQLTRPLVLVFSALVKVTYKVLLAVFVSFSLFVYHSARSLLYCLVLSIASTQPVQIASVLKSKELGLYAIDLKGCEQHEKGFLCSHRT